jgi:hypothetical protein
MYDHQKNPAVSEPKTAAASSSSVVHKSQQHHQQDNVHNLLCEYITSPSPSSSSSYEEEEEEVHSMSTTVEQHQAPHPSLMEDNNSKQDDEVLEQMLLEAERLAGEITRVSMRGQSDGSTAGGSRFVPDTIQVKDSATECSSMEYNTMHENGSSSAFDTTESSFSTPKEMKDQIIEESESYQSPQAIKINMPEELEESSKKLSDASLSSHSSRRQSQVEDALRASEEMVRQLEAMTNSPSSSKRIRSVVDHSDSPGSLSSSPESLSPAPASPESICGDSKTTAKISHVNRGTMNDDDDDDEDKDIASLNTNQTISTTPNSFSSTPDIKWEKVEFSKEQDDDYVPMSDYVSKESKSPDLKPRMEGEIKWEKVNSPNRADPDYVPLVDYSSNVTSKKFDFMPDRIPNFDRHRVALRRKVKKQRRTKIFLFVLLLSVIAAAVYKQDVIQDYYETQMARFQEPVEIVVSPEEQAVAVKAQAAAIEAAAQRLADARHAVEKAAAEKEAAERKAAKAEVAATEKELQDVRTAKLIQNTCGLPFAGLFFPICRTSQANEIRPLRWINLVQAMLQ